VSIKNVCYLFLKVRFQDSWRNKTKALTQATLEKRPLNRRGYSVCVYFHWAVLDFWATVICPVCDVGVLWPNGWTDQDETWHAGRLQPWPHCVR